MLAALERFFLWTSLRSIGNSPAAKATIFIPLLGYLIIFNEYVLQYAEVSKQLLGTHDLSANSSHISLRLLGVYFGLCLIAVGSVAYAIWCPQPVKTFESSSAYIAGVSEHISFIEMGQIESTLKSGKIGEQLDALNEYESHRPAAETLEEFRNRRGETEAAILDLHFQQLNHSYPLIRIISAAAYIVGFVALAIPSFDIFARVMFLLARPIFGVGQ